MSYNKHGKDIPTAPALVNDRYIHLEEIAAFKFSGEFNTIFKVISVENFVTNVYH